MGDHEEHLAAQREWFRANLTPPRVEVARPRWDRIVWRLCHPLTRCPTVTVDVAAMLWAHLAFHRSLIDDVGGVHDVQRGQAGQ